MKLTATNLQALKLADGATEEAINTAIEKLTAEKAAAEAKLSQIETAAKAEAQKRAETLIDKAIADKKLTAGERAEYIERAASDFAFVEKTLSKLSAVKLPGNVAGKEDETGTQGKDSWTLTDWRKKDPQGLQELKVNDPEAFNKLVEASK